MSDPQPAQLPLSSLLGSHFTSWARAEQSNMMSCHASPVKQKYNPREYMLLYILYTKLSLSHLSPI